MIRKTLWLSVRPETEVLFREARKQLVQERGEKFADPSCAPRRHAVIDRLGEEVTFRREGRNRFTRATREVEAKEALRGRGFDRDQVKAIMARTATHVGDSDISAEQWLAVALRYAAELATGAVSDRTAATPQ